MFRVKRKIVSSSQLLIFDCLMQPALDQRLDTDGLLYSRLADLLREVHATEVRATHGAEMSFLGRIGGQRLVMIGLCRLGIEREVKLIHPAELEACLGKGIIMHLSSGMSLGQIGSVSSNLIGNDPVFHIVF